LGDFREINCRTSGELEKESIRPQKINSLLKAGDRSLALILGRSLNSGEGENLFDEIMEGPIGLACSLIRPHGGQFALEVVVYTSEEEHQSRNCLV
jgi:hypothetical protein